MQDANRTGEEDWWIDWPIDDLRLIRSEQIDAEDLEEDNAQTIYCIYSFKLDSVTFIEGDAHHSLLRRGIIELDEMPRSTSQ